MQIHDDDLAADLPCFWVNLRQPEDSRPGTVLEVERAANGSVFRVRAREESGGSTRSFSRFADRPFECGCFALMLGARDATDEQVKAFVHAHRLSTSMDARIQGFRNYGEGGDTPAEQLAYEFKIPLSTFDNIVRLCGVYGSESYDGDATVFYEDDEGLFFEVSGSHCSCYGLEDTWRPSLVTMEYIRRRAIALQDDRTYGREMLPGFIEKLWGPAPSPR